MGSRSLGWLSLAISSTPQANHSVSWRTRRHRASPASVRQRTAEQPMPSSNPGRTVSIPQKSPRVRSLLLSGVQYRQRKQEGRRFTRLK